MNVTGGSLASPSPVTSGGTEESVDGGELRDNFLPHVAQALSIHTTAGVTFMRLMSGSNLVASFPGAAEGPADITVSFAHPISFDGMYCFGTSADSCSVYTVGG